MLSKRISHFFCSVSSGLRGSFTTGASTIRTASSFRTIFRRSSVRYVSSGMGPGGGGGGGGGGSGEDGGTHATVPTAFFGWLMFSLSTHSWRAATQTAARQGLGCA